MDGYATIQQVADQLGLSVHTLRYYERIGLIAPVSRAGNGHRRYTADDLSWIRLLVCLRATGMSIRALQEFAATRDRSGTTVDEALAILERHREAVIERQLRIERDLAVIERKIARFREQQRPSEDGRLAMVSATIVREEESG